MPSGSHGGGGGFGGHGGFTSSSFSSGRSSSSDNRSYSPRPRGPRYFRFGHRTLIITTGRQSVLSLFAFFAVVAAMLLFSFVTSRSAIKQEVEMIKEEYAYYQNMVEYAEANRDNGYVVTATVTEVQYDAEIQKYRYFYSFKTASGANETGYTFYLYTLNNKPVIGSTFELAVDSVPITSNTDSIPVDYKLTKLEDDGAYTFLKSKLNKYTLYIGLSIGGIILLIGSCVAVVLTAKRKEEEKQEEQKQQEIENEKKKFCQYCGTKIKEEDATCPNCGSRLN